MSDSAGRALMNVTLPDGREVEHLLTVWDDSEQPAPPGHLRVVVYVAIDGEMAALPVLLTPEDIARSQP